MKDEQSTHLTVDQLVAYLGHELPDGERGPVEQHLARCVECRDELVSVHEILRPEVPGPADRLERKDRPTPRLPWRVLAPITAAAAAVILLVAGPWGQDNGDEARRHRDAPAQSSLIPTPVAPIGDVPVVDGLVWQWLEGADRYRLTVYDAEGGVVWKTTTSDTVAPLPDSVEIDPGASYLWRLEARTEWDRWEPSDLVEFRIVPEPESEEPHADPTVPDETPAQ